MTQNATETLLDRERARRGLNFRQLGDILGVKRQSAWRYCKGLQRPERGEDGPAERLKAWSNGKVHAGNFDQLQEVPAAKPKASRKRRAR